MGTPLQLAQEASRQSTARGGAEQMRGTETETAPSIHVFTVPALYLRPTIALPAPLHPRISLAKPEHEAAQVGSW